MSTVSVPVRKVRASGKLIDFFEDLIVRGAGANRGNDAGHCLLVAGSDKAQQPVDQGAIVGYFVGFMS